MTRMAITIPPPKGQKINLPFETTVGRIFPYIERFICICGEPNATIKTAVLCRVCGIIWEAEITVFTTVYPIGKQMEVRWNARVASKQPFGAVRLPKKTIFEEIVNFGDVLTLENGVLSPPNLPGS